MADDKYPEHTRRRAVSRDARVLGAFLDWLEENEMTIATWSNLEYQPVADRPEALLARYFGISLAKIEEERVEMLEAQRALNERHNG